MTRFKGVMMISFSVMKNQKKNLVIIILVIFRKGNIMNYTRTINIDGPAGNAINLIATAKTFAKDLGYTSRAIRGLVNQMLESNDYDRLVQIFLFYFGDYVTLIDREGESKNDFYINNTFE